jgi:uncharacterized membrane protein YphA (DoxX/SURF4 family)
MTFLELLYGLLIATVFLLFGIAWVFFPKRMQKFVQGRRPANWQKEPLFNWVYTWMDDPSYVAVFFVFGLLALGVGLFLIIGICSTIVSYFINSPPAS